MNSTTAQPYYCITERAFLRNNTKCVIAHRMCDSPPLDALAWSVAYLPALWSTMTAISRKLRLLREFFLACKRDSDSLRPIHATTPSLAYMLHACISQMTRSDCARQPVTERPRLTIFRSNNEEIPPCSGPNPTGQTFVSASKSQCISAIVEVDLDSIQNGTSSAERPGAARWCF